MEARCNVVTVGGNTFTQSNELLFFGRCNVSRSWVVRTMLAPAADSKINVASLSYTIREVSEGGGLNERSIAMTRVGDVILLRGREVSIIPTGSAGQAFPITCTCDVAESVTPPQQVLVSQGQTTIAAAGNGTLTIPRYARQVSITVNSAATPIRVNFNNDAGALQSTNTIATANAVDPRWITIPGHAIGCQIFNDDGVNPVTIHAQWNCIV